MFLNTFPVVVRVCVSGSIVSVLNIYRRNVCKISIEMKSQHLERANIEISENSFVRIGQGTLPPPRKVCYLLVACWVRSSWVRLFIRYWGIVRTQGEANGLSPRVYRGSSDIFFKNSLVPALSLPFSVICPPT